MKCLIVVAHPVEDSLCRTLARSAIDALVSAGHEVEIEDLYRSEFAAALTAIERRSYYAESFDCNEVQQQIDRLLNAEALVLVFPTWWFGFPAILKGWFDRVWAPDSKVAANIHSTQKLRRKLMPSFCPISENR
jgi:putative NADPH-quinone reductase